MLCRTTRKGIECVFMTRKGCTYIGDTCLKVIEKCAGCTRITDNFCSSYPDPALKWAHGYNCPMATNIKKEVVEQKKLNPIKASKKGKK